MKEIILSNGLVTLVDDVDYDYLNQFNWNFKEGKNTYYANRTERIYGDKLYRKHYFYMHLEIFRRMGYYLPKGYYTDHKDRNGLNNQRENIWIVTGTINNLNSQLHVTNTSGYKGVSLNKRLNKWSAQIGIKNKMITLGHFSCKEEAIECRKKTEEKIFSLYILNYEKVLERCRIKILKETKLEP